MQRIITEEKRIHKTYIFGYRELNATTIINKNHKLITSYLEYQAHNRDGLQNALSSQHSIRIRKKQMKSDIKEKNYYGIRRRYMIT